MNEVVAATSIPTLQWGSGDLGRGSKSTGSGQSRTSGPRCLAACTTKRLTIKPFRNPRKRPVNDNEFDEEKWQRLAAAIRNIHTNQPLNCSLEELFKMAKSLAKSSTVEILYQRLEHICEEHIKTLTLSEEDAAQDEMHINFNKIWLRHCKDMRLIINIFIVLDRQYLLKHTKLPSIWEMSASLFKKYVISTPSGLSDKLVNKILTDITSERAGNKIDTQLLASLIHMITDLGLYEQTFEADFLAQSDRIYEEESKTYAAVYPIHEYLAHVAQRYKQEQVRIEAYLQKSTSKRLLAIIVKHFLEMKLEEVLDLGIADLLEPGKTTDADCHLKRLYSLASYYKRGHALVQKKFSDYVKKEGTKMVMREKELQKMVPELLEFKDRADHIVDHCFESNTNFKQALRDACEVFINKRPNKPAELIARFIDNKMRSKGADPGSGADNIDTVLNKVMVLFRCIHGKDTFEAYYKKDLAKRLIQNKSANVDAEKNMLKKLKFECGAQFTAHLEGMFRDIETSKEVSTNYCAKNPSYVEYIILTKSNWPAGTKTQLAPLPIQDELEKFKAHYTELYTGRALSWQPCLGIVILKCTIDKPHEFTLSVFQALILLMYNDEDEFTFKQILDKTLIEREDLERSVQSLALGKIKILQRLREAGATGAEVADTDRFKFNDKFTHKQYRIKISQVVVRETKKERKQMEDQIIQDRQYQLDAAIVRIMKAKKELNHQELLTELFSHIKFPLQAADAKKRIESLIDRDYLERCDDDGRPSYKYIA